MLRGVFGFYQETARTRRDVRGLTWLSEPAETGGFEGCRLRGGMEFDLVAELAESVRELGDRATLGHSVSMKHIITLTLALPFLAFAIPACDSPDDEAELQALDVAEEEELRQDLAQADEENPRTSRSTSSTSRPT